MSKKKVILSTIAILLVMFAAVSVVSYSIANLGHGENKSEKIEQNSVTNLGAGEGTYVTHIDLILQNAANNETFNIVEITPGDVAPSALKDYSTNDAAGKSKFAEYVLYANRSTFTGDLPTNLVNYKHLKVNSLTTLSDLYSGADTADTADDVTVQNILDAADLIYLSSPEYTSYNGVNDLNEEMYNYLHVYALGSDKPIIVDFVTASSASSGAPKTYNNLAATIARNYVKFRTFPWESDSAKTGYSAADFFGSKGSYYLKYYVNNLATSATGKVLVLSDSTTAADGTMAKRMQDYTSDEVIANAYYGMPDKKPTEMTYVIRDVKTTPLKAEELDVAYDFILIEKGVSGITMDADVYTKLRALSESSKYIFYDSSLATTEVGNVDGNSNNYLKLLRLLVSEKGVELTSNVLAINYGFFTSLNEQEEDGVEGAKAIADLINGSVYRNSGTSGEGARKYRVLEIQPCYPVDLELAESAGRTKTTTLLSQSGISGGYYTRPDQVLYGVTKDEIEEGTEYYAFEISRAKIAAATGKPYDQIEVHSISSSELISNKTVILEQYDLVYIGGDASALLPYSIVNYKGTSGYTYGDDSNYDNLIHGFTAFDMYSHTGNFVNYADVLSMDRVGTGTNSVETSGNDLTTIKRDELKDYVDAGLPIIIDMTVAKAFEASYAFDKNNKEAKNPNRLEQLKLHDIDPDSNMYQALAYAYEAYKSGKYKNVGWGTIDSRNTETPDDNFHNDETQIINEDRKYGNTLGSMVTVYDTTCNTAINKLITDSNERPKLVLDQYPKEYVEGDPSTTNVSSVATFKASVESAGTSTAAQTYTLVLYVDANGDGNYSEMEEIDSTTYTSGDPVELTYELDDDFFGLVNWKIKAISSNGKLCDMKQGCAFFKIGEDMKKNVRVLQIMPVNSPTYKETSATIKVNGEDKTIQYEYSEDNWNTDGHSLYFCTDCQQASKVIKHNLTYNYNEYERMNLESYKNYERIWGGAVKTGLHEHDFGIVEYEPLATVDNWEKNFADPLTHGVSGTSEDADYEFDLDILTVAEFEQLCSDAVDRDEAVSAAAAKNAEDLLTDYEEELEKPALKNAAADLEKWLYTAAENIGNSDNDCKDIIIKGIGTKDDPGLWMRDQQYYRFWTYFNSNGANSSEVGDIGGQDVFNSLATAYNKYIELYDVAVGLRNSYKINSRQNGDDTEWLYNNYDVIVLGLADEFNNMDLTAGACAQIKSYVKKGGAVLNSHDTISAKKAGAQVMSAELRDTFGMDRFHVTGVQTPNASATVSVPIKDNPKENYTVYVSEDSVSTQNLLIYQEGSEYAAYSFGISDSDLNIALQKDQWNEVVNVAGSAAPTEGNRHDSVQDELEIVVEYKDTAGNPLGGRTLILDERQYDGKTITSGTTDANGKVTFKIPQVYATTEYQCMLEDVYKSDIEADIVLGEAPAATLSKTSTGEAKDVGETLTITFNVKDADGNVVSDGVRVDMEDASEVSTTNGVATLTYTPVVRDMEAEISLSSKNVVYDMNVTATGIELKFVKSEASTADTISATFNVTGLVTDGTVLTLNYAGTAHTATVTDGKAIFTGIAKTTVADDVRYRRYDTKDNSKYFWTERLQAGSAADYQNVITDRSLATYFNVNAPVGITNLYATYDSVSLPVSIYKYAAMFPGRFEYDSNVDLWNYEAKYGTRRVEKVNEGGVTMYPFVISDQLLISPTHGQTLALDLEDPTVAVWYTLAPTAVNEEGVDKLQVSADYARNVSSFYAASPRDGMNSYYLYSKDSIFYTGAGHQVITGRYKDNNDERRLFINVIVNCVTKGVSGPKLKLYNICDKDENCEDYYVDPKKRDENKTLSKEINKLFYNDSIEMYQYNIDESQETIYPEFDFKAIAGTTDIKKIEVFYDLNYDPNNSGIDGMDSSNTYNATDGNHIPIASYDKDDQIDGTRFRLREETHANLILKEEYFENYNNYTYIVVRVQDERNKWKHARIKINVIPYLFDLTDAGSEAVNSSFDSLLLDMSDRKFNI